MEDQFITHIKKIYSIIQRIDTRILIISPFFLAVALIIILINISPNGYTDSLIQKILVIIILFTAGFSGLPMVIRREFPFAFDMPEIFIFLQGLLLLIIFWGSASILLFFMIFKK